MIRQQLQLSLFSTGKQITINNNSSLDSQHSTTEQYIRLKRVFFLSRRSLKYRGNNAAGNLGLRLGRWCWKSQLGMFVR